MMIVAAYAEPEHHHHHHHMIAVDGNSMLLPTQAFQKSHVPRAMAFSE
jgi:hypothetical protein